jgi:hypothetical protein
MRLRVEPQEVTRGQNVTVHWNVPDGQNVRLDPGNLAVPAQGERVFTPTRSTTYVLTAEVGGETLQTSARVAVVSP